VQEVQEVQEVEVKVTFVTADATDVACFLSGDEQTGQAHPRAFGRTS
jgi:hypothetical protein